jgi:hypothetical protein
MGWSTGFDPEGGDDGICRWEEDDEEEDAVLVGEVVDLEEITKRKDLMLWTWGEKPTNSWSLRSWGRCFSMEEIL